MLTANEMLAETGYPKGGIPPCDLPALFFVDTPLSHRSEAIYAGGGTPTTLLHISPHEILRLGGAQILSISKAETRCE
jgi:prolyl-tRNA editing enzyme YbaK/EbsC (Cys-tRNA(Pro) deacylase)